MRRNLEAPMDAESFRGMMQGLRANSNEIERRDIARRLDAFGRLVAFEAELPEAV